MTHAHIIHEISEHEIPVTHTNAEKFGHRVLQLVPPIEDDSTSQEIPENVSVWEPTPISSNQDPARHLVKRELVQQGFHRS